MRPPSKRLDLTVQFGSSDARHADIPPRTHLQSIVRAALVGGGAITLRFVGLEEGQTLNRDYRGKDYATNVLSFPYEYDPLTVGDLVICTPVVQREAEEQSKNLRDHLTHLLVHGTLHLQGWDHEDDPSAEEMEAQERVILASLGIADPYQEK